MPRNRSRAARRVQQRTEANRLARLAGGLEPDGGAPIRTRARSQSVIEALLGRGSITKQQAAAAERLEASWRASGSMIGRLVQKYEQVFRDRRHAPPPVGDDSARAIAARTEVEGALQELGKWLSPVIVHVVIADLPVASWAQVNGRPAPDALGALRLGLDCLVEYFNRPRRDRRPRRDPPAAAPVPAAPTLVPPPRRMNGHAVLADVGREDQEVLLEDRDEHHQGQEELHQGQEELHQDQDAADQGDALEQVDVILQDQDRDGGVLEQPTDLEPETAPAGSMADLLLASQLGAAVGAATLERALAYAAARGRPFGDHLDQEVERLAAIAAARAAPPPPSGHTTRLREPYHHPKL